MKSLLTLLIISAFIVTPEWQTNFEKAQAEASQSNKLMLLSFSGFDWCGPCIKMKTEIFESDVFIKYASENLVLIRADFPRQKKNKLDEEQVKRNDALAEKFNPQGKFPYTILLDSKGKVIKEWDGFPKLTAYEFVDEIKATKHARN